VLKHAKNAVGKRIIHLPDSQIKQWNKIGPGIRKGK
jgi:hypothetical protein